MLWAWTVETTREATRSGALCPVTTDTLFLSQDGVDFVVRVLGNIARKRAAGSRHFNMATERTGGQNPFLPYDPHLYVANVRPSHVLLLNKFNVLDHHLLIVTAHFEHQERLLTPADFQASWLCLDDLDGLVFYNGGLTAGASQPHKHLQLVPVPLAPGNSRLPLEQRIVPAEVGTEPSLSNALSFPHAVCRLDANSTVSADRIAERLHRLYLQMLVMVGVEAVSADDGVIQSRPYNLLLTREWMMIVPRTAEAVAGIPVNALGFAGALLVKDESGLDVLRERGVMEVLRLASS
jgi:ATP adenylyltransferase